MILFMSQQTEWSLAFIYLCVNQICVSSSSGDFTFKAIVLIIEGRFIPSNEDSNYKWVGGSESPLPGDQ